MSISDDFNVLIQKRKLIEGDVDYDNDPVVRSMIDLMIRDVVQTTDFIKNDCSSEQFVWMSEIFDEIIEKTKSPKIIDALRETALKYPEETKKYNINYFIDSAAEYLD